MAKIFVSYRRQDSPYVALTLKARLEERFGKQSVFLDIDNIPMGVDFRKHIDLAVKQCDVMLVIIGDSWLRVMPGRQQNRLFDPQDFVRAEIEAALRREIPIIPVLVEAAEMPSAEDLPESIRELIFRHSTVLRAERDFDSQMERLIEGVDGLLNPVPEVTHRDVKRHAKPAEHLPAAGPPPKAADDRPVTSHTRDAILEVVASVPNNFIRATSHDSRLKSAIASYAPHLDPSDVIIFFDLSVWGRARTGLILTSEGMFWREFLGTVRTIRYEHIEKLKESRDGDGNLLTLWVNDMKINFLAPEDLEALVSILKTVTNAEQA